MAKLKQKSKVPVVSTVGVSVIIPTYNASAFLEDALGSVRDQTLRDFECLIIDDASTDGSLAIARQFAEADARFRSIALPANSGVSAARNRGFSEARGRWLAVLDADDLFMPNRLEFLTCIGDEEGADLVIDDQIVTAFPALTSHRRAFGFAQQKFAISQDDFFSGSRLFRRPFPAGYSKPLIRRDFLHRTNAAYDALVRSGEDFLFYAQLFTTRPRCIGTSFAGYVYRRRRGSVSWSEEHFHVQAKLSDRVLRDFGAQLSPFSRSAVAARKRELEEVASAMPAVAALRRGRWLRFAALLVKQPRIAGTILRRLRTRTIRSWANFLRAATPGADSSPS